ncbi:aminotransferase class V-fold PLP-dependent enzyme [Candidatus Saccharibacteria bacterium]|nr:aminotransferase class V-fold PLP-dependent enzyme [Candidatus Saccharibacteria bacterium]
MKQTNNDFNFLPIEAVYFDSACQSLRPQPVQDALTNYYQRHNSCGERAKYPWGHETDHLVDQTRQKVLDYLRLKPRHYFVSFTQNTTYGINLLLNSLTRSFDQIITTDIEHNSPFLATMEFARKHNIPRHVIDRHPDGSIPEDADFSNALVVVNAVSNIDSRRLENLTQIIKKVQKQGGVIIVDAAQAMAHESDLLHKTEADAICFSAHKMYAPSLGGMIVKRTLIPHLKPAFIGGGMVDDVQLEDYQLSSNNPDHTHTIFEPGLQSYGEIIALGTALDWIAKQDKESLVIHCHTLYDFLKSSPKVHLVNQKPTPVISFYVDGLDSHLLGTALAAEGIMTRTGYFCCHYYLDHKMHLPPLVRLSLGYHTRPSDIEKFVTTMQKVI